MAANPAFLLNMADALASGRLRILSIDGAGIYGLTAAIWLRQLCLDDPAFLSPAPGTGHVHILAGISAGALNCLLLAKEDDPRRAVLDGTLERFWQEPVGAFSNTLPGPAMLSLLGIGGWFGMADFVAQLDRHFGDMRLGDLKQSVIVPTFNWAGGNRKIDFNAKSPFSAEGLLGPPYPPRSGQPTAWRPKIFTNLRPDDADLNVRVADVAYGAATPPGWRTVRGGIGDAGVYTANPAVNAISEVIRDCHAFEKIVPPEVQKLDAGGLLERIALLGLGDGSVIPHYWLADFDLSGQQFGKLPTNPFMGQWYAPSATIDINASAEEQMFIALNLLGPLRFYNLDPGIMQFPTLMATTLSRFPAWKQFFVDRIYKSTTSDTSVQAVSKAGAFLKSPGWMGGPDVTIGMDYVEEYVPPPAPPPPPPR